MMAARKRLAAIQVQAAIRAALERAQSQSDAERGALAAAISIVIATRGPAGAVDLFRDLADLIERDELLDRGRTQ